MRPARRSRWMQCTLSNQLRTSTANYTAGPGNPAPAVFSFLQRSRRPGVYSEVDAQDCSLAVAFAVGAADHPALAHAARIQLLARRNCNRVRRAAWFESSISCRRRAAGLAFLVLRDYPRLGNALRLLGSRHAHSLHSGDAHLPAAHCAPLCPADPSRVFLVPVFACFALPGFNYQAANARPYALGMCLFAAALLFLIRWLDTGAWLDALLLVACVVHLVSVRSPIVLAVLPGVSSLRRCANRRR